MGGVNGGKASRRESDCLTAMNIVQHNLDQYNRQLKLLKGVKYVRTPSPPTEQPRRRGLGCLDWSRDPKYFLTTISDKG